MSRSGTDGGLWRVVLRTLGRFALFFFGAGLALAVVFGVWVVRVMRSLAEGSEIASLSDALRESDAVAGQGAKMPVTARAHFHRPDAPDLDPVPKEVMEWMKTVEATGRPGESLKPHSIWHLGTVTEVTYIGRSSGKTHKIVIIHGISGPDQEKVVDLVFDSS